MHPRRNGTLIWINESGRRRGKDWRDDRNRQPYAHQARQG